MATKVHDTYSNSSQPSRNIRWSQLNSLPSMVGCINFCMLDKNNHKAFPTLLFTLGWAGKYSNIHLHVRDAQVGSNLSILLHANEYGNFSLLSEVRLDTRLSVIISNHQRDQGASIRVLPLSHNNKNPITRADKLWMDCVITCTITCIAAVGTHAMFKSLIPHYG